MLEVAEFWYRLFCVLFYQIISEFYAIHILISVEFRKISKLSFWCMNGNIQIQAHYRALMLMIMKHMFLVLVTMAVKVENVRIAKLICVLLEILIMQTDYYFVSWNEPSHFEISDIHRTIECVWLQCIYICIYIYIYNYINWIPTNNDTNHSFPCCC